MNRVVTSLSPTRLAHALDGELLAAGTQNPRRVCTDTRAIEPGDCFVAIRGERFDGHGFVAAAIEAGAAAVVVERGEGQRHVGTGVSVVEVDDSVRAMGHLANAILARRRARGDFTVVALTGSNGKTTTKEMIAALYRRRLRTLSTRGNFNNWIGMPLTVFELEWSHQAAVLELGANAQGEIAWMTQVAQPDVCVLTSIGPAHLEGFGGIEGVVAGKGEIFREAEAAEAWILPSECRERFFPELAADERVIEVGVGDGVRVTDVRPTADGVHAHYAGVGCDADGEYLIPILGAHNATNFGLALAAASALDLERDAIEHALESLAVPDGRMQIRRMGQVEVIQDAYNANPASMQAALDVLAGRTAPAHRVAVLGEMREMGDEAVALHRALGEAAAAASLRVLCVVCADPALASAVVDGATAGGLEPDAVFAAGSTNDDVMAVAAHLRAALQPNDVMLLKGSRGVALERVLDALDESR